MSEFNFVLDLTDRILALFWAAVQMGSVCFKGQKKWLEMGERILIHTDTYIYACMSGP